MFRLILRAVTDTTQPAAGGGDAASSIAQQILLAFGGLILVCIGIVGAFLRRVLQQMSDVNTAVNHRQPGDPTLAQTVVDVNGRSQVVEGRIRLIEQELAALRDTLGRQSVAVDGLTTLVHGLTQMVAVLSDRVEPTARVEAEGAVEARREAT